MDIINCRECGKELSSKAEICPNCGVRVKKKSIISKIFRFFEVIGVFIVIGIIIFFLYKFIVDLGNENRRKSYVGTWILQTNIEKVNYEEHYKILGENEYSDKKSEYTILIDKELVITDKNSYFGSLLPHCEFSDNKEYTKRCDNVPPIVRLNHKDKIVAINFTRTDGQSVLLCFKKTKDLLNRVSCEGTVFDSYNDVIYTSNSGLNKEFNIQYKKID